MEALLNVAELTDHFRALSKVVPLHPIRNEHDYDEAVNAMNALLDAGAADETHPLADLVATLGELIADYDQTHYAFPDVTGVDALRFLMEQHHLTQAQVPEIGSQGVVSEILKGRRELNVRQIRALAARFGVATAVFFPADAPVAT
ncbi:helix-turn-helix domain-containing protein [Cupriavidus basilensis]|uniref:helix-turn-helix domain-containing protein n=1 Tax=Cupriavidus basilensis TaxID=68895 RepID=UPI0023E7CD97|nr:transcriptional regulator [Cupriavidus basilensis]MDF3881167.1 transcriptional regulator [Cupriavidus basilensis]